MDISGTCVNRKTDPRPWHQIDKHTGGHDRYHQSPLTKILLSDDNITKIQYAIRMLIFKKKGIDIGMQNRASIYNELYAWYKNYKYSRIDYKPEEIPPLLKKLNYAFTTQVLLQNVLNGIDEREVYTEWALKVPEPMPQGMNDNNYNSSVSLDGYYNDSIGSNGFSKGTWNWRQDGMYDEPESIYVRYPNDALRKNNGNMSTRKNKNNEIRNDCIPDDSRFY